MSSDVKWTVVQKLRETKSLFLLYFAPNLAVIVPKRFFRDQAQMAEWRSLIQGGVAPKNISKPGLIGRWF
jgi:hypothetical protein